MREWKFMMQDAFEEVFGTSERVMAVFAHPDDLEIFCGGTVARLVDSGVLVRAVCVTDGGKGVRQNDVDLEEFQSARLSAQVEAARELGISARETHNLGLRDGEVEDNVENVGRIVRHIREFKPDLVITHEPSQHVHGFDSNTLWLNHRDHRKTAGLVFDAIYPYSRDRAFFPQQLREGLETHEVHNILFADAYTSDHAVGFNVEGFLKEKRAALSKYIADGSVTQEELEEFMVEGQQEDGWFEILGWLKDIH